MNTILLLEDDKNLNRGISMKLQKEGYIVHSAYSVREAEQLFEQFPPDMIISDITLPDGSGLEFCSHIRQKSSVFILFLTALDSEIDMVNGYDTGGDALLASMGEFGSLITAFDTLSTSAGGLYGILINLVSQTEVFQRLSSILADSVLPVLNAFLEPLMPLLELFSSLIQTLIMGALAPAFPVLKMVASMLTFVVGLLKMVIQAIYDAVTWLVGWIMRGLIGFVNGIISIINWIPFVNIPLFDDSKFRKWSETDVIGNIQNNWNDMMSTLDTIASLNMEIADNTSESSEDLSVYNDLLQKGLINSAEYASLITAATGRHYDNVLTYGDGAYWTGSGGSTNISQDNISIVINGDGLDAKEIAEEVIRQLGEKQRGGGKGLMSG